MLALEYLPDRSRRGARVRAPPRVRASSRSHHVVVPHHVPRQALVQQFVPIDLQPHLGRVESVLREQTARAKRAGDARADVANEFTLVDWPQEALETERGDDARASSADALGTTARSDICLLYTSPSPRDS